MNNQPTHKYLEPPPNTIWEIHIRGHIQSLENFAEEILEDFEDLSPKIEVCEESDLMVIRIKWNSNALEKMLEAMVPNDVKIEKSYKLEGGICQEK